ncbi:MAG: ATP-dependent Lon protease [Bradymonadia bacterium]|jgi:ATP-dependent Lon protease
MADTTAPTRSSMPTELPALAVKNAVVFPIPSLPVPLTIGRARTLKAVAKAAEERGIIFMVSQRSPDDETPEAEDLYEVGAYARILRMSHNADGSAELIIDGLGRGRIERFVHTDPYLRVEASALVETSVDDAETEALSRMARKYADQVVDLTPRIPDEAKTFLKGITSSAQLTDLIASQINLSVPERQSLLEELDVKQRLTRIVELLAREVQVLEITGQIRNDVRHTLDQHQREAYLREQMRAIRRELGEGDEEDEDLSERIDAAKMPTAAAQAARRALKRMSRMNPQSAEYNVARSYIDWLLDVPWDTVSTDTLDLPEAKTLLERDHYGLSKVKRRILEYLAVRKLKDDMKGPILCLVGPPGVGKTSLGKSIAEAMGREFVRISLGGVRDEAEIRGHRRTYIGALPGRFIKALKKATTMNPVIVLDEIDKLGNDFRGDPSSALLEVLDPAQNAAFADHYLEVPVDLSRVLFITTANQLGPVPPALRDRMEVIEIPGYIEEEKYEIARRHLLPRQLHEHGLNAEQVTLDEPALRRVIGWYTREAGVRNLDRQIAGVLRSVAVDVAMGDAELPIHVDPARVRQALGPQRVFRESSEDLAIPGVAIGLAWTPVGGEILFIEATTMRGKGQLKLTGQLGEVMKESAHTALSYIRSRAEALGIDEEQFSERTVHLHLPSGAIPKDGPSAGVTIVVALVSLLTGTCMRQGIAMTGEITLRGVVLPVGGIKEKVLAAARAGMNVIILPRRNGGDLEEIPEHLRAEMTFHLVDRIEEAVDLALGISMPRMAS